MKFARDAIYQYKEFMLGLSWDIFKRNGAVNFQYLKFVNFKTRFSSSFANISVDFNY